MHAIFLKMSVCARVAETISSKMFTFSVNVFNGISTKYFNKWQSYNIKVSVSMHRVAFVCLQRGLWETKTNPKFQTLLLFNVGISN